MSVPLFNFRLRDWKNVEPWTYSDGTKTLSWFGFSDGWYWLSCGNEELFRYTPDFLKHRGCASEECYCDYTVARLWEDILHILPKVLEPVPEDLAPILADEAELLRWSQQRVAWFESDTDLDAVDDEAINWVGGRFLDSLYLVQGPQIVLWRTRDVLHIRWNNSEKMIDGVPVWIAKRGLHEMSVETFLSEVESFHNRFTDAMKERVNAIAASWNRSDIEVDIERLIEEQSERENALNEALGTQHETNWESVREGTRVLNEFPVNN